MSYVDEKEIPESTRGVGSICPPGFIAIHRADWERVNQQVVHLQEQLAALQSGARQTRSRVDRIVDSVIQTAASTFGYTVESLRGSGKLQAVVDVRTAIVAVLEERGIPRSSIARGLDRDVSGIWHLAARHNGLSEVDRRYRTILVELFDACTSPKPN